MSDIWMIHIRFRSELNQNEIHFKSDHNQIHIKSDQNQIHIKSNQNQIWIGSYTYLNQIQYISQSDPNQIWIRHKSDLDQIRFKSIICESNLNQIHFRFFVSKCFAVILMPVYVSRTNLCTHEAKVKTCRLFFSREQNISFN